MHRKLTFVSIFTLMMLMMSCSTDVVPDSVASGRQESLLYSGHNENVQDVIVQLNVTEGVMHQWIEKQDVSYPSRSPDGTQVAYFAYEDAEVFSLWIADNLGQNARKTGGPYPFHAGVTPAEWSYDSQYLAFRVSPNEHEAFVYVIDVVTGHEIVVVEGWDFSWSRLTNHIAIYNGVELQLVSIPDGAIQSVLQTFIPNPYDSLDWLSDRQTIVFPADSEKFLTGIYAVDVDSDNVYPLLPDDPNVVYRSICCVQVSPNGEYLSFVTNTQTKDGDSIIATLMMLDINKDDVLSLAENVVSPITWSPDSTHIVFGSTEDESGEPISSWDLLQISLNDNVVTQLTYNGAAPNGVTW